MRYVPDDKKKDIISRWLYGESKEKISTSTGLSASTVTGIINGWKRELRDALADAHGGMDEKVIGHLADPANIIQSFRLVIMLRKLGVNADSVDDFLRKFSKVVLSTGVTPEGLANIVKQTLKLADLDGIEIFQIPSQVETLMGQKQNLEKEVAELKEKKDAIERSMPSSSEVPTSTSTSTSTPTSSTTARTSLQPVSAEGEGEGEGEEEYQKRAVLSEFGFLVRQLNEFGLSLTDVAAFTEMIRNSKKYGYDFASVLELVSSLKSLEQQKSSMSSELKLLHDSEKESLERKRSIEEKLATVQPIIDSIDKLKELGFDLLDFESIYDCIEKAAKLEGSDLASAKAKFFNDVRSFYHAEGVRKNLQAPIPVEGGEREPGENRDLVEMLERLTSKGITEQTLVKCVIINDLFKVDLDTLADDLKKYHTVKDASRKAIETRARLEFEELELKHKLIALEEQRQRLMSSMKELIDESKSELKISSASSPDIAGEGVVRELEPLARKMRGEIVDLDELKVSLSLVIDAILNTLDPQSLTRKILDHAKLALKHEQAIPRNSA